MEDVKIAYESLDRRNQQCCVGNSTRRATARIQGHNRAHQRPDLPTPCRALLHSRAHTNREDRAHGLPRSCREPAEQPAQTLPRELRVPAERTWASLPSHAWAPLRAACRDPARHNLQQTCAKKIRKFIRVGLYAHTTSHSRWQRDADLRRERITRHDGISRRRGFIRGRRSTFLLLFHYLS